MTEDDPKTIPAPNVRRAIAATYLGILSERVLGAFWPALTLIALFAGFGLLGLQDFLPVENLRWVAVGATLLALVVVVICARRFRLPRWPEAIARVDETLDGRPLQALADTPLVGRGDAASNAIWRAHIRRMQARLAKARAVAPDLRLSSKDPYALRLMALTVLGMGLIFGSVRNSASLVDGAADPNAVAQGPVWEGWIKPPAFTGKPTLYLSDLDDDFDVPKGSGVTVRIYGEDGSVTLRETVSDASPQTEPDFPVLRSGDIEIDGPSGRLWNVALLPDQAPQAELVGEMTRAASGETRQVFRLTDDFGVARAVMSIEPDLEQVVPRFGYVLEAETREAVAVDVVLPLRGERTDIEGLFAENFSQHPFSGLPVRISLTAWDEAGQQSAPATGVAVLPGRRFFDPLAAAIIDLRREILWNRKNALRTAGVLRAATYLSDDVGSEQDIYNRIDDLIGDLETLGTPLTDEQVAQITQAMWDLAVDLEEGELAEALERLRRAQEQLQQAMRDGATPEEIERLMQELREATQDYIRQLAEQQGEDGQDGEQSGESQEMSQDQLQQLMDRIQELMEQGRMAEAQQLMDMLNQMLENMRVTQGQGQGEGDQSMQGLQDMLRDQQELNDDTFSDLQNQFGQQQGQQGQQQGQGQDQQEGQGQGQQPGREGLAERQEALRDELDRQRGRMPFGGSQDGNELGDALDRAGRAMEDAEDALRNEDFAGALDSQAEALENLREGMRQLGEQMAQNQQAQEGQQGEAGGSSGDAERRDPLGRSAGDTGQFGSDEELAEGRDQRRRAEELMDEIRRRSAEQERPEEERDYLDRLLDRF